MAGLRETFASPNIQKKNKLKSKNQGQQPTRRGGPRLLKGKKSLPTSSSKITYG